MAKGVQFKEHTDTHLNSLKGQKFSFNYFEFMANFQLHYIDIGQNDKVDFYGNKDLDICFRFIDASINDTNMVELTDVYFYPEFYEKPDSEINEELITHTAIGSVLLEGKFFISDDKFDDLKIDAFIKLRDEGKLK